MLLHTSQNTAQPGTLLTGAAIVPVIEQLSRYAPFDSMEAAHLEFLARRLKLGFYAKGETIIAATDGPARRFFIIKQGLVRGETDRDSGVEEDGAWELMAGECFPIGALTARRPVHTVHRAAQDTFCYELSRDDFDALRALSPAFHDFCSRRLANLLHQALRDNQSRHAARVSENASFSAPLRGMLARAPVVCAAETPLSKALETMHQTHVGSIVITDTGMRPLGMFTLHDLIPRVILADISLDAPIVRVMTPQPLSLSPDAFAYEAALLMAREGIGHVCVVENGALLGVVSERDLFSLQRVGLVHLSRAITSAADIDTLSRLSRDVHQLIDQMLAQGVAVEQLTQIITLLNDHLTRRVIHLCITDCATPPPRFTWLAFGSEGRQEQTLKTDQDNGMLFVPDTRMSAEATRAALLPLAQRVNAALAECGFPLCEGKIMAGNPQWCLSDAEWKEKFADWIHRADAPVLLNATIFFDFRTLYGDPEPVHELRAWLHERIKDNRLFLRSLSENALANRPPLGLVRDFVTEHGDDHADTLDLKINGITPFVDAARIFALAAGIDTTATVGRLRAAARVWHLDSAEVDAWVEAFWFMQLLRLRLQFEQRQKGLPLSNRIDPNALNDLDRRILKEAFRQARKLQTKFEYWFLV